MILQSQKNSKRGPAIVVRHRCLMLEPHGRPRPELQVDLNMPGVPAHTCDHGWLGEERGKMRLCQGSFSLSASLMKKIITLNRRDAKQSPRYLNFHVHSSIIHSCQEVETPRWPQITKASTKYDTHAWWGITQPFKEGNLDMSYSIKEPRRHFAKWNNKSVVKDKHCKVLLLKYLIQNHRHHKLSVRSWRKGKEELVFSVYETRHYMVETF